MPYSNAEFDQSKQHVQGIYRKRINEPLEEDDGAGGGAQVNQGALESLSGRIHSARKVNTSKGRCKSKSGS